MTVVINDLEVVATGQETASGPGPAVPAPAAENPTPFELRALLRHIADRADRARAD